MNKRFFALIATIIFILIVPSHVGAKDYCTLDVTDESGTNFSAQLMIVTPLKSNEVFIGKSLSEIKIAGGVVRKDSKLYPCKVSWKDPSYVVVSGEQSVGVVFKSMGSDKTFTGKITLVGVKRTAENDPSLAAQKFMNQIKDTIEETKKEIASTPLLTATTIVLEPSTSYDINFVDRTHDATCTWTSSDESVATVDKKNGKVYAKKEGKATITCSITNHDGTKITLKTEVKVGLDANSPALTKKSLDLNSGDTFDLNVENQTKNSECIWTSSDRSIVRVNAVNGKVTAKAPGNAFVTCTILTSDYQVIVLKCDIKVSK